MLEVGVVMDGFMLYMHEVYWRMLASFTDLGVRSRSGISKVDSIKRLCVPIDSWRSHKGHRQTPQTRFERSPSTQHQVVRP